MSDEPRINREGMVGPYGARYPWVYWVAIAGAAVLIIIDLFHRGAEWTTIGALVLIAIAVAVRPGGLRGPRHAVSRDGESRE